MKDKKPVIPREEHSTIRQTIMTLLEHHTLSARDISAAVRIPEREVIGHLEHIRASTLKIGRHLQIIPAVCKKCGFSFSKRERLSRPGKCPICHNEQLAEPLYCIQ
jgi:predicted Zn-ribbon and HTH transcriptional regulator